MERSVIYIHTEVVGSRLHNFYFDRDGVKEAIQISGYIPFTNLVNAVLPPSLLRPGEQQQVKLWIPKTGTPYIDYQLVPLGEYEWQRIA